MRLAHLDKAAKRVYVRDLRIHHGLVGLALLAYGFLRAKRLPFVAGLVLTLDDLGDFPFPLHDAY